MAKERIVWETAEGLARNRLRVLSLYRRSLRGLNSPDHNISLAERNTKKAELRRMFNMFNERSLHNTTDLLDALDYTLTQLHQGREPSQIEVARILGIKPKVVNSFSEKVENWFQTWRLF
ncbi:hypothetical protein QJS10_CPB11g00104 [Acorus calamus]|uniref:LYR motif containing domain-containing protein n=1 Tax=Acorus calamus TaxID=4465 RepID=A0AAV9DTY9_ACOCL|nr:hypothetical protein QJS10_CPB11g00104 [Acorus calamus]